MQEQEVCVEIRQHRIATAEYAKLNFVDRRRQGLPLRHQFQFGEVDPEVQHPDLVARSVGVNIRRTEGRVGPKPVHVHAEGWELTAIRAGLVGEDVVVRCVRIEASDVVFVAGAKEEREKGGKEEGR